MAGYGDKFRGRGGGSGGGCGQGALCLGWVILEEEAQIAMSGGKCGQALAWEQTCGIKVSDSAKSRTCKGKHKPW